MARYEACGQTITDVYVIVEADSEEEALKKVEDMYFYPVEYCNETVGVEYSGDGEYEEMRVCASGNINFTDVEEV